MYAKGFTRMTSFYADNREEAWFYYYPPPPMRRMEHSCFFRTMNTVRTFSTPREDVCPAFPTASPLGHVGACPDAIECSTFRVGQVLSF